jgi:hypothetical protein
LIASEKIEISLVAIEIFEDFGSTSTQLPAYQHQVGAGHGRRVTRRKIRLKLLDKLVFFS